MGEPGLNKYDTPASDRRAAGFKRGGYLPLDLARLAAGFPEALGISLTHGLGRGVAHVAAIKVLAAVVLSQGVHGSEHLTMVLWWAQKEM